jgi:hypothetical protein
VRRIVLLLIILTVVTAACSDDDAFPSSTTAASSTTGGETTTSAGITTSSASTTAPTTTTATTVPGTTPVDFTAFCVRGTAPDDSLAVRSGPGTDFDTVGELAWNAADVPAGGFSAPDGYDRPWFQVESPSGLGWAASWHLEPAPCAPSAITEAALAGPGWPDALAGDLVPWNWVDEDWVLALYTPTWGSPYALYLVSPHGEIFEVYSWDDGETRPFDLYDWRPDGGAVLVAVGFHGEGDPEIRLLDLQARSSRTVATGYLGIEGFASFSRPTGRDLVVRTGDGTTERIEVRRTDGSLFSILLDHLRPPEWYREATWLYSLEGTTVVVADGEGLQLLSNLGDWVRDLASPGEACRPVRWWDATTFLARCLPPEVLAYLPNSYYGRLWLVPIDGGAATALTALPADPVFVGDFGFFDARQASGRLFANWGGDCGAASVNLVDADGTTAPITSSQMIGTVGSNLVVRRWDACDQSGAGLHLVGPDGTDVRALLVPPPTDSWGVIDALMLPDLP